jgi:FixJ family two-component response regulator
MLGNQDTVYVIDPDKSVHDALTTLLGASGVDITCFSTAEALLESNALCNRDCGCLLVEANLPGMGSLALVRQLHARYGDLPIIVLASTSDRDIADQALKAGAVDVFDKPLISGRLLDRLNLAQSNL